MWPVIAIATRSGIPARTKFRTAVRRRSCGILCEHCKAALADLSGDVGPPPDPYAVGLTALKAALPQPTEFEEDYKLQRFIQLETGYHDTAHHDARAAAAAERLGVPVAELRMAVDDATSYAPPDSWAAGIKALQEKQR